MQSDEPYVTLKNELWSTEYCRDTQVIKAILHEELRLMQKEYGTAVGLDLNTLSDLIKEPEVHKSVIAFRVDFQSALAHTMLTFAKSSR